MRASLHGLRESTWRGCYEPLLEPAPGQGRIYYVEFFRTRRSASEVRSLYERRRTEHKNFTLNLLIERIGQRAPDPGGTAVWTIPDFASLAEISLELGDTNLAVEPVAAGTYAPIGAEIL